MIETIILNYLSDSLEVPSYLNPPADKPDEYIRLRKSGSSGDKFIETAIFIFLSVSTITLQNAAQINDSLKNALFDMPGIIAPVSRVELNSDGNFTDTTTKEYRYQAIFEITYHR